MKILILEDDKNRIIQFKRNLIGHIIEVCSTSKETIEKLKIFTYDYLFLDHDLGGKTMVKSGENTGYEVAMFLHQNPERQPARILIHSFNTVGAQNIKSLLPNAVIAPGVWSKIKA